MGVLSNGAPVQVFIEAFREYGEAIGIARQLALDHNIFWGSGMKNDIQHGRLIAKKKSLPIAYAFEHGSPKMRRILGEIYMARVVDPAKIGQIELVLEEVGARGFTMEKIQSCLKRATQAISKIDLKENQKTHLRIIAENLSGVKMELFDQ